MIDKNKIIIGTAQLYENYGINNKIKNYEKNKQNKFLQNIIKQGYCKFDTSISYEKSFPFLLNFLKECEYQKVEVNIKVYENQLDELFLAINEFKLKNVEFTISAYGIDTFKSKKFQKFYLYQKEIKTMGISIYEDEIDSLLNLNNLPDFVQLPINIVNCDKKLFQKLRKLKRKNLKIVARSIFLQGLLFKNSSEIKKIENLRDCLNYFKLCSEVIKDKSISLALVSFKFAYLNKFIDSHVIGMEGSNQIDIIENYNFDRISCSLIEKINNLNHFFPKMKKDPRNW